MSNLKITPTQNTVALRFGGQPLNFTLGGGAQAAAESANAAASSATDAQASAEDAQGYADTLRSNGSILPAYSLQFPNFNRKYAGLGGKISYPTTGLTSPASPIFANNQAGAFYILLQIPRERTNNNVASRVFGNFFGPSSSRFGVLHYEDDHFDTPRHDSIRMFSGGSVGGNVDLSVDVQLRKDAWQLIVFRVDGSGNYSLDSFAAGQAKIAGDTATSNSHSQNAFNASLPILVGDAGTAADDLSVLADPHGAFGGAIAMHGFVIGDAGSDADWQNIVEGADIETILSGATEFRLHRDYRQGQEIGDMLAATISSDPSAEGSVHGVVHAGGHAGRQTQSRWLTIDRIPDGFTVCPPNQSLTGHKAITGQSAGVSGDLMMRCVDLDGRVIVTPRRVAGAVGAVISENIAIPTYSGWAHWEFWAKDDPDIIYRINSRIGCGDKAAALGQSQVDIAFFASGVTMEPSGLVSFATYTGLRADPDDTTASPQQVFEVRKRPQLFVIEPEMTDAYNAVTSMGDTITSANGGKAVCIVDRATAGTSAVDLVNDSLNGRFWEIEQETTALAGNDHNPIWQWYTSDPASDYGERTFDAVVKGVGVNASDHSFADHDIQAAGYIMGVCLPTRATFTGAGPFDSDTGSLTRERVQDEQIAWVERNVGLAVLGPACTDVAIDNNAAGTPSGPNGNLGGPHLSQVLPRGCVRLGERMGETYLRARGLSSSPSNSYLDADSVTINAARDEITFKFVLSNPFGKSKTDGAPAGGVEISENGGTTWTRSGFTYSQLDNETWKITKDTGAWPPNVQFTYLRGGPFSYGTSEELAAHYRGSFYDGSAAENGLGLPILGISSLNAVTLA